MPYFTPVYSEGLIGKTVKKIELVDDDRLGSVIIRWTDGSHTKIDACVEFEQVTRQLNLVVNTFDTVKSGGGA